MSRPCGDGDLAAGEPLHSPGRVVEQVADVAGLPAGVADGVSGLADLQAGEFLDVLVDDGGEAAQEAGPVGGGRGRPAALRPVGAQHRGVDLVAGGPVDRGDDFFGRRVEDVVHARAFRTTCGVPSR